MLNAEVLNNFLFLLSNNTLSTMGQASETSDEKTTTSTHVFIAVKDVDTAAELASGEQGVLDPAEALRIRFVAPESHFQTLTYGHVDARSISMSSH